MDYTLADEMAALFPSKAVQQYVLNTGWEFKDAEKVALLEMNINLTLAENHLWKRRIAEKTSDEKLKKKLIEWVEFEEKVVRQAPENSEHRYIYALQERQDSQRVPECYATWDAALAAGKARYTKYKTEFSIHKILPEDVEERDDELYLSYDYDIHGELKWISYKSSPDYSWDFQKMWFEFPNPFEKGDIIKTRWGDYGIVDTTQKNWKLKMDRCRKETKYGGIDSSDNIIYIQELDDKNGCFCEFCERFPYDLEYYEPKETWREDYGSLDKLLMCASLYMRGEGSLHDLHTATMEYREKQKNKRERLLQLIVDILGKNRWMTYTEIKEQMNKEDQDAFATHFVGLMCELTAQGRIQSITSYDECEPVYNRGTKKLRSLVYEVYYCGLEDRIFSDRWTWK